MSNDFRGARIDRSAFGEYARVDNRHSAGDIGDTSAAGLGAELERLREHLQAAAHTDDGRVALLELDALEDEVARETPRPDAVRHRWETLRSRLAVALPVGANIAQIASLVAQLTG